MIIRRNRPLANDHQEGPASCKKLSDTPVTLVTSARIQIQSRGPFWNNLFLFLFVYICCERISSDDQSDQVAGDRRMTLRRRRGVLASLPSPYPVTCTNIRTLQLCIVFVVAFVLMFKTCFLTSTYLYFGYMAQ